MAKAVNLNNLHYLLSARYISGYTFFTLFASHTIAIYSVPFNFLSARCIINTSHPLVLQNLTMAIYYWQLTDRFTGKAHFPVRPGCLAFSLFRPRWFFEHPSIIVCGCIYVGISNRSANIRFDATSVAGGRTSTFAIQEVHAKGGYRCWGWSLGGAVDVCELCILGIYFSRYR